MSKACLHAKGEQEKLVLVKEKSKKNHKSMT